jgi:hypothetical protein
MGQCAPEDSISQCPFLQMIDTAGNPHADGSAAPGARPRHRPSRHRDPPATSRAHDNWMAARQTSCRQQTAPPPPRCSKDVTAHPHRPGARPGRPCQVPARSGQPLSGRSGFSPAFGTEFFYMNIVMYVDRALDFLWLCCGYWTRRPSNLEAFCKGLERSTQRFIMKGKKKSRN